MHARALTGTTAHRGDVATVVLTRAPAEEPITFRQRGASATLAELRPIATARGVTVASADGRVRFELVEHLLAALGGLGIRAGVRIDVEGDELPLLDGGAAAFCAALVSIGATPSAPVLEIALAAELTHGDVRYVFEPGEGVEIEVDVDFPPPVGRGRATWGGDAADFATRIARARTFAWRDEVLAMRAAGRALGEVGDAAVVFDGGGGRLASGGALHGDDEPARHKLLDLVGDLALYGGPPKGRVVATRPGHGPTHAVFASCLESGVVRRATAATFAVALLFTCSLARAESHSATDAPAPPTLQALVHDKINLSLELTGASVQPSGDADAGRGRAGVWFLHSEVEYPLVPRKWYLGLAEDLAGGAVPGVGAGVFPSSPEIWVRGIWSNIQGLSSGGGFGLVIPAPHDLSDAGHKELSTVQVARPWDDSLFAPMTITLRPWLDVRHVAGRFILQLRQGLDVSLSLNGGNLFQKSAEYTAFGGFYAGVRATPWLGVGLEFWESYAITAAIPDDQRASFALSPGVRLLFPGWEPALSVLFPISTPLRGQASSYVAARFNMTLSFDQPFGRK